MLIDTHCHLDAEEFSESAAELVQAARQNGVRYIVIPAVAKANFTTVQHLAQQHTELVYALGIHPLFVPQAELSDLDALEQALEQAVADPRLVAVGEIGLDFFVPELKTPAMQEKQRYFYDAQLKLARQFDLPVLLHVRRSQDQILKYLRRHPGSTGIAHAFNGSHQQAQQFMDLGFALGFGGAMTFTRAKQIRRLAAEIALAHVVLETDAPDIGPAWLDRKADPAQYNRPAELAAIAEVLAQLRQQPIDQIHAQTSATAFSVLPRLAQWHQQNS